MRKEQMQFVVIGLLNFDFFERMKKRKKISSNFTAFNAFERERDL
jgi:hypothetical protein